MQRPARRRVNGLWINGICPPTGPEFLILSISARSPPPKKTARRRAWVKKFLTCCCENFFFSYPYYKVQLLFYILFLTLWICRYLFASQYDPYFFLWIYFYFDCSPWEKSYWLRTNNIKFIKLTIEDKITIIKIAKGENTNSHWEKIQIIGEIVRDVLS